MSVRIYASVELPQGARSNPATLAEAFGAAFSALEQKVVARDLRPVWDTLEVRTDSDEVDDRSFPSAAPSVTRVTTGTASVLAIDPKEVSE